MALKKEEIFQKKPSKEESTYQAAISLMDAVDCVGRFERKVDALRDAAAMFDRLGDYQDAKQRKEDCLEEADEAEEQGCRGVFALGMKKKEKATTKSNYIDAMEEFRRLRDYEPYQKKVQKEIQECKQQVKRIETRAAYKRCMIILLILAVLFAGLSQTPVFPVAKGIVCYIGGEYEEALKYYKEAEYLPGVDDLMQSAYNKLEKEKQSETPPDRK